MKVWCRGPDLNRPQSTKIKGSQRSKQHLNNAFKILIIKTENSWPHSPTAPVFSLKIFVKEETIKNPIEDFTIEYLRNLIL